MNRHSGSPESTDSSAAVTTPIQFHPNYIPNGAALYLHVPFCTALCDFCAFKKSLPSPGDWDRYRAGLEAEWESLHFEGTVSSVFWGGGTPGLLKASDILRIGELINEQVASGTEWTVELTPLCPTREKLKAWCEIGVNRLSLGVQSFSPRLLKAMGRPYDPKNLEAIVGEIREAGFKNLNLDLIIAFPGQTVEELEADLEQTVALSPDHVSVYCLTLEEDTALYTRLTQSGNQPDPDQEASLYERAWCLLEEAGFHQYEISNFAREGSHCNHHLNVWSMGNWRGIGPSAASQIGSLRFRNAYDLKKWSEFPFTAAADRYPDLVESSDSDRALEKIIFGLRKNSGISTDLVNSLHPTDRDRVKVFLEKLESEGYLVQSKGNYRLTLQGRLLADEISQQILG
ncbi:MAG: radical SAM family heme chaperone HemW [Verrucomicrobiota bacterium]